MRDKPLGDTFFPCTHEHETKENEGCSYLTIKIKKKEKKKYIKNVWKKKKIPSGPPVPLIVDH